MEIALEEAHFREDELKAHSEALRSEVDVQRSLVQRHLTQVCHAASCYNTSIMCSKQKGCGRGFSRMSTGGFVD